MSKALLRALIPVIIASFFMQAYAVPKNQPGAQVKFLIGKVQVQSKQKTKWRTLRLRQKVYSGDRIKTFLSSRVELNMPDGSVIKVNQNSIFEVKTIKTKAHDNEDKMSFSLFGGSLWAQFKKLVSTRQTREIESPSAVVAIRGTILDMKVDQNEATRVRVFEGRVAVRSKTRAGEVLVGANQQSVVEKGKAPSPPRPIKNKAGGAAAPGQSSIQLHINSGKLQFTDPAVLVSGLPVSGRVTPGATITANGVPLNVRPGGQFEGRVQVREGLNAIRFQAHKDGQSNAKTMRVLVNTKRPQIQLSKPIVAGFINRRDYSLSGAVFDLTPQDRVKVYINDEFVTEVVGRGSFNRTVILNEGKNIIKVRAVDISKNETLKSDQLFLDTVKPILTITEPAQTLYYRYEPPRPPSNDYEFANQKFPQTIRGLVIDPEPSSGIKRITINGKEIKPRSDGSFEAEIYVQRGNLGQPIENRLNFYVEDMAGNITRDNSHVIIVR